MLALLAGISWFIPTSYVAFAPGITGNLAQMVRVSGGRIPRTGKLLMVAISVIPANLLIYALAHVDNTYVLHRSSTVLPDMNMNQYVQFNYSLMDQSQKAAAVAGESLAGLPAKAEIEPGVVVAGILKGGTAANHLRIGDRIVRVGSHPITITSLYRIMHEFHVGEVVPFTVIRHGQTHVIPLRLTRIPQDPSPGVGIVVSPAVRYVLPRPVVFHSGNIGGPSAGMMFALEIYQQVTGHNLAGHQIVAGTGEVGPGGLIGAIGGIVQKVITVHAAGAKIFLCPQQNYPQAVATARARGYSMKIYPVQTLAQAEHILARPS